MEEKKLRLIYTRREIQNIVHERMKSKNKNKEIIKYGAKETLNFIDETQTYLSQTDYLLNINNISI